ncbi:hypothetical protein KGQ20_29725 [Catenulispora sp. NF23]|uniref:hypothetical protein n=1 Tax=Catenulispora pinistramenti TaxID=2705254 RepID=UPI001BA512BA|nr:hypothetical protein [Catenulispora pinistramenti]MBS2536950.1 hypothetical protein [Catenulispora pinistramenti]
MADLPAAVAADAADTAGAAVAPLDATTRMVCAQAYWDPTFAAQAEELLLGDAFSAIGPPVGLDLPVILQHARHSLRIDRRRDWALLACWVLVVLCVAGPLVITRGTKDFEPTVFGVLCGVASVATLAWTIATTARWLRVHAAFALLRTPPAPPVSAPPLPPDVHAEIVADQASNVVCYPAGAPNPFAAFGELLGKEVTVRLPPAPARVDATDLHLYLANELARDPRLADVAIAGNLFVRGDVADDVPGLWPGGKQSRPSRQAHALIYSVGINPGDRAQTYLTFQTARHDGGLMISMHVRIREQNERIVLGIASTIATPPAAKYTSVSGPLPRTLGRVRAHARWYTLLELPGIATEAWSSPLVTFVGHRLNVRARKKGLRRIRRKGRLPERGARTSLRRWIMDPAKITAHDAEARDVLRLLREALFEHLVRYFQAHELPTGDLMGVRDAVLRVEGTVRAGSVAETGKPDSDRTADTHQKADTDQKTDTRRRAKADRKADAERRAAANRKAEAERRARADRDFRATGRPRR